MPLVAHPERTEAVRRARPSRPSWPRAAGRCRSTRAACSGATEIEARARSPWQLVDDRRLSRAVARRTAHTAGRGRRASTRPTSSVHDDEWRRGTPALRARFDGSPRGRSQRPGDGFHLAQLREALERLGLDLAHALARQAEPAADLLERLRLGVVEAVAERSRLPLALAEGGERLASASAAERDLDLLLGQRPVAGHEVAEDGVLLSRRPAGRGSSTRERPPSPRAPARPAGSPPRRSPRASARGRAASRASARRGSASASARRCARASGSSAPCRRARGRRPGGSTRSRRSRTCSRGASRTSRRRGSGRACPPGSGRGTAVPGCGSSSRSRRRGAGSTGSSAASPRMSPRSMRLASSTSWAAVSSGWRPASRRKSCSASVVVSWTTGGGGGGAASRCASASASITSIPRCSSSR